MPQSVHKAKAQSRQPKRGKVVASATRRSHTTAAVGAAIAAAGARSKTQASLTYMKRREIGEWDRVEDHPVFIVYHRSKGVDAFVRQFAEATPIQIVETERTGVRGTLIKDLSKRMDLSAVRIYDILRVPKATIEGKAKTGATLAGRGGQVALGMVRLLGLAQRIVANSTANEARDFDVPKWFGQWIERPQPSLGGRKPADLLDTPTGIDVVARLLGSIESGAYQ